MTEQFRFWNKTIKRYAVPVVYAVDNELLPVRLYEREWRYAGDIVVERFTGLYDMKDRPIYEGDIVAEDSAAGMTYFPVVFADGAFCLPYEAGNAWLSKVINTCPYKSGVEVVGNIHENADLLRGKK